MVMALFQIKYCAKEIQQCWPSNAKKSNLEDSFQCGGLKDDDVFSVDPNFLMRLNGFQGPTVFSPDNHDQFDEYCSLPYIISGELWWTLPDFTRLSSH